MFIKNNFQGVVPSISLNASDKKLIAAVTRELKSYVACLEKQRWVWPTWDVGVAFVGGGCGLRAQSRCSLCNIGGGQRWSCDITSSNRLRDGLRHILNISRLGNGHMQANQPWVLVKGTPAER